MKQTLPRKLGLESILVTVLGSEHDEHSKKEKTHDHLGVRSALTTPRDGTAGLQGCFHVRMLEHGFINDLHVF
jgi:hypothetical protein